MTNNELGNTTLESLGILTGQVGLARALSDPDGPDKWEMRFAGHEWRQFDGPDGWRRCAIDATSDNEVQWRRKPEPKREPMRYVYFPLVKNGRILGAYLSSNWAEGTRTRVTIEELLDTQPARPVPTDTQLINTDGISIGADNVHYSATAPGTIITWQEAQRRVDAGLGVETPDLFHEQTRDKWFAIDGLSPSNFQSWTYRIPLQPAEAVTMTAIEATEWLKTPGRAVVSLESGAVYDSGTSLAGDCKYVPLLPAARSQVGLERELANANATIKCLTRDWQPLADWAQAHSAGHGGTCASVALDHIAQLEQQLTSAIASQKAALAALEVERKTSASYASRLFDIHNSIQAMFGKTAGKESG